MGYNSSLESLLRSLTGGNGPEYNSEKASLPQKTFRLLLALAKAAGLGFGV